MSQSLYSFIMGCKLVKGRLPTCKQLLLNKKQNLIKLGIFARAGTVVTFFRKKRMDYFLFSYEKMLNTIQKKSIFRKLSRSYSYAKFKEIERTV